MTIYAGPYVYDKDPIKNGIFAYRPTIVGKSYFPILYYPYKGLYGAVDGKFASAAAAMAHLDEALILRGIVIVSSERFEKLKVLL